MNTSILNTISTSPSVVGNGLYGSYILDSSDNPDVLAKKVCCLNDDWAKGKDCSPWRGEGAEVIKTLDAEKGKSKPYVVDIDGKRYVAKVYDSSSRWSKHRKTDFFNTSELRKSIAANKDLAKACLVSPNMDNQYIGMDDFANEMLVALTAKRFLEPLGLKGLINDHLAYSLCGKYAIILTEFVPFLDMYRFAIQSLTDDDIMGVRVGGVMRTSVKPEIISALVKQMIVVLRNLQAKGAFIHGDLRLQNVLVSEKSTTGVFEGLNISGKYSIKLSDFSESTISIKSKDPKDMRDIRFFNEYRLTRFMPSVSSFPLKTTKERGCVEVSVGKPVGPAGPMEAGGVGKCYDAVWWELPSSFNQVNMLITAHSGLPFYSSFDFYTFMVSLMMVPQYYYGVMSSVQLKAVWNSLWRQRDIDTINSEVLKYHSAPPERDDILSILKKASLRCDALVFAAELLK